MRPAVLSLLLIHGAACGRPVPIHNEWVVKQVTTRYHSFYSSRGDPDLSRDAGLLRPRFGLPAIAPAGDPFDIEVLERGDRPVLCAALLRPGVSDAEAQACLLGVPHPGCYPLHLGDAAYRRPVTTWSEVAGFQARALKTPPPGGYDLYLMSSVDAPTRVPRAVWLRPRTQRPELRVAHLSDLHVGKGGAAMIARLRGVIRAVNRLRPDLVVITGDLVNRGQDPKLPPQARALLLELQAPVLTVMGNHDLGFSRAGSIDYGGPGWANWARTFHPFLHYSLTVDGYDFVGFDSGPSDRTPWVATRGLAPASLADLRTEIERSRDRGHRGVVLFSHAPSRATTFARIRPRGAGVFGHMRNGRAGFERLLLDAALHGQRVLHLAGHTHWTDVFEAQPGKKSLEFARWTTQSPCLHPIAGKAAIITTQAAGHSGVFFKDNARGYGFSFLLLGDGDPEVAFHRYGTGTPAECPWAEARL